MWRESHGADEASEDLKIKLFKFLEAAKMAQGTGVVTKRNFITKLRHAISKAEEELVEEDIANHMDGKNSNPTCVKKLNELIGRPTAVFA
ncbi:hypothetical protein H4R20_004936 [Coemansia guatemalensis]|uniref:Uncharacterized protein n=1 Tax=Coemansia guatemalensis TaxID=2761395 RepID=A0A9W8LQ21_9FUNG|nr:hypothetical protein H4R20_004936 [Coemansia guatemalensis]